MDPTHQWMSINHLIQSSLLERHIVYQSGQKLTVEPVQQYVGKKIIVQFLMFPAFNPTVKQSRVALELTRPVGHWVGGPCIHESVSKSKFTEEFHGNGPILQKKQQKKAWNKLHVNHSCFDHTINH